MRVLRVGVSDFRNYERAELSLGAGLTVICGPNGAGKTNLLEALYFGASGRSCRTSNERECVRAGQGLTRVVLDTEDEHGDRHRLEVGFAPGEPKHMKVDGAAVERLADSSSRPLVSVFLPDRLELVKGAPALRRAHLDQVVTALRPSRAATRAAYWRALAQRNALIARVRGGHSSPSLLDQWDAELARHGIELMSDRRAVVAELEEPFARLAAELGLHRSPQLRYRPRSRAAGPDELATELAERREEDLSRGFTAHGPHRDDVALSHDGRSLRAYGSQGQQRVALLALLFAEREVLTAHSRPLLMLLDDVMSELDLERRERLIELVRSGGQAVITTTDPEHVPGARSPDVLLVRVNDAAVLSEAQAA